MTMKMVSFENERDEERQVECLEAATDSTERGARERGSVTPWRSGTVELETVTIPNHSTVPRPELGDKYLKAAVLGSLGQRVHVLTRGNQEGAPSPANLLCP